MNETTSTVPLTRLLGFGLGLVDDLVARGQTQLVARGDEHGLPDHLARQHVRPARLAELRGISCTPVGRPKMTTGLASFSLPARRATRRLRTAHPSRPTSAPFVRRGRRRRGGDCAGLRLPWRRGAVLTSGDDGERERTHCNTSTRRQIPTDARRLPPPSGVAAPRNLSALTSSSV